MSKQPRKKIPAQREAPDRIATLSIKNRQIKRGVSELLRLPSIRKRIEITSRPEIMEAARQFSQPEHRQALKMLKSEISSTRMVGIHRVADFIYIMQPEKRKKAIKIIEAMLEDPNPQVVGNAAEVLLKPKFVSGSFAESFAKALDHENPECRRIAAISLNTLDKKKLLNEKQLEAVLVKVSGALSRETNETPVNKLTEMLERHIQTIKKDQTLRRTIFPRLSRSGSNAHIDPESRERLRKIGEEIIRK